MVFRFLFILSLIHIVSFGKTVAGTVKNATNGKSIPNANIYIVELKQGRITNPYGYFEIELPKGSYTIHITNIGFKSYSSKFEVADQPI
ncbi:uncharacterized protein METZ01_LOCUS179922, partial [marine metagenome]